MPAKKSASKKTAKKAVAKKTTVKKTVTKKAPAKTIIQQRPTSTTNFILLIVFCFLVFVLFTSLF